MPMYETAGLIPQFAEKSGFCKITPVNGFDTLNPDNAKQNNYCWSMEEMGDYIYVGTGRDIL